MRLVRGGGFGSGCGENFADESGLKCLGLRAITGRQPIFSGAAGGVVVGLLVCPEEEKWRIARAISGDRLSNAWRAWRSWREAIAGRGKRFAQRAQRTQRLKA